MLEMLVSVPAVTAFAAVTVGLLVRDMLEREAARPAGGRPVPVRYRWYGLGCLVIFLVLATLRFIVLPG